MEAGASEKRAFHEGSVDPYMLQRWYPYLKPFTAETKLLPLSRETAQAMLKGCERRRKKGNTTEEHERLLAVLLTDMQALMTEPCFAKLSARSCKDSILRSQHFKRVLSEQTKDLGAESTPNDYLTAYVRAQCFAMRRDKAEDVLEDMLESRRIYEDLTLATLEKDFSLDIVFRKWDLALVPEYEIRVFINDSKVCAMSQYYSSVYVPRLHLQKHEIEARVLKFLEGVVKVVPLTNYVVDVGMSENDTLSIVELNPPAPRSGPSLFTWNYGEGKSGDNEILLGRRPFEFRVLTAPKDNLVEERSQTFDHLKILLGKEFDTSDATTSEKCVIV